MARTIWGMIVTLDLSASRLVFFVSIPSKWTVPSVKMHRRSARVSELFDDVSLCK